MHSDEVRKLSTAQQNCILSHIDGPQRVPLNSTIVTRRYLVRRKLLVLTHADRSPYLDLESLRCPMPKALFSSLTEAGRHGLAAILAGHAEVLVRAGFPFRIDSIVEEAMRRSFPAAIGQASAQGAAAGGQPMPSEPALSLVS